MTTLTPATPPLHARDFLQSPLLSKAGFAHAFFTRQGGVSEGVFESLNFGLNYGDTPQHVQENLRRVAATLHVAAERIYFLSQVHGVHAVTVDSSLAQQQVRALQGDIVLTGEEGTGAAIRTADCVPVLIGCRTTRLVAACHSGWQGCVRGAAPAAVQAMRAHGARDLVAAIGPHISLDAFEVGSDVAAQLLDASPDKGIVQMRGDKPHVDLRRMVRAQLRDAQLSDDAIDDVYGCTVGEPERYFSYRRDKNPSGRMLSVIVSSCT